MERASARSLDSQPRARRQTLAVSRRVYEAAWYLRWREKAADGKKPSVAATEFVAASLVAGDNRKASFWSEVHLFLVANDHLCLPLQITEDPVA